MPINHHKHFTRLADKLSTFLRNARTIGMTHEDAIEAVNAAIFSDPFYPKLRAWQRDRLSQRWLDGMSAMYQPPQLYAHEHEERERRLKAGEDLPPLPYLVWRHRLDGVAYPDCRGFTGDDFKRLESAHVWTHTGQPYSRKGWTKAAE